MTATGVLISLVVVFALGVFIGWSVRSLVSTRE